MGRQWDPVELEPDPDHVVIGSDGTVREHVNHIMSERMVGEVQSGYRCIQCLEFFEEAWPEKCHVCGFAVSDKQGTRFGREFVGNIRLGPSTTTEEELAIAEEMLAREERRVLISKPNIIVPSLWN